MKVSPGLKTAASLGLLLAVVGAGAVGLAHVLRQRAEVLPAPADVPASSVTPPAVLPGTAVPAPGASLTVMPPSQSIAVGEPVPGSNLAVMSGFILAGSASPSMSVIRPVDVDLVLLEQLGDATLRPDKALLPWSALIADKSAWSGHPVGRPMYLGGSGDFDERSNGREFYA